MKCAHTQTLPLRTYFTMKPWCSLCSPGWLTLAATLCLSLPSAKIIGVGTHTQLLLNVFVFESMRQVCTTARPGRNSLYWTGSGIMGRRVQRGGHLIWRPQRQAPAPAHVLAGWSHLLFSTPLNPRTALSLTDTQAQMSSTLASLFSVLEENCNYTESTFVGP